VPPFEAEKKPIEISKAMSNDGQSEEDVEMASDDKISDQQEASESKFVDDRLV